MNVKEIRTTLGLTQAELAAKLGVALNTVGRWESGANRPTKAMLRHIARLERKALKKEA